MSPDTVTALNVTGYGDGVPRPAVAAQWDVGKW
jgi:hypothetical protein